MGISHPNLCLSCRQCCTFVNDEEYFAPIFTKEEKANVIKLGHSEDMFKPHKGNLSQLKLITYNNRSKVCPFLMQDDWKCGIYEARPFDCKIAPFIVEKSQSGEVSLGFYKHLRCKLIKKYTRKNTGKHKEIAKIFDDFNIAKLFKENPELVWDYDKHADIICSLKDSKAFK